MLANAPVYLLNTGKLIPQCFFARHRQINAPVHLLDTGKLMPQGICYIQAN